MNNECNYNDRIIEMNAQIVGCEDAEMAYVNCFLVSADEEESRADDMSGMGESSRYVPRSSGCCCGSTDPEDGAPCCCCLLSSSKSNNYYHFYDLKYHILLHSIITK